MDFKHFTAGADDNDRRLDKIIRKFLNQQNLSGLYKSIRSGLIKINDRKAKAEQHIFEGDKISIASFLLSQETTESKKIPQTLPESIIVLKNDNILILNKPYDINVQKASKNETALNDMVMDDFIASGKNSSSLSFRPGPLHRLDRKTTGLIAFSQSLEGARYFSEGIKNHTIQKIYLGLVEGNFKKTENWKDNIEKNDSRQTGFKTVTAGSDSGDEAETTATPLAHGKLQDKEVTLVQFHIKTGRTHQIRSQSSLHGFPLIGDTAYNGTKLDSKISGQNFYLHAACLLIPSDNPVNLPAKIECPLNEDFKKILSLSLINTDLSLNI